MVAVYWTDPLLSYRHKGKHNEALKEVSDMRIFSILAAIVYIPIAVICKLTKHYS